MNAMINEFKPRLKKGSDLNNANKYSNSLPLLNLPRDVALTEQLFSNPGPGLLSLPISNPHSATRLSSPGNNFIKPVQNVDNYRPLGYEHIGLLRSFENLGFQLHNVPKDEKGGSINNIQEQFQNSETGPFTEGPLNPWQDERYNKSRMFHHREMNIDFANSITDKNLQDVLKNPPKLDYQGQELNQLAKLDPQVSVLDPNKSSSMDKPLSSASFSSPWTWGQYDRVMIKLNNSEVQLSAGHLIGTNTIKHPSTRNHLIGLLDESSKEGGEESAPSATRTEEPRIAERTSLNRISVDGTTYDLKSGMISDQFGMFSLLYLIKSSNDNSGSALLLDGICRDDFPAQKNNQILDAFCNPWSQISRRPQDLDHTLPKEYLTNAYIKQKLPPIKLSWYTEDLLFYLFYVYGGDAIQMTAAYELYQREWRYHKTEQVWLERIPGISPVTIVDTWEQGTYFYFDVGTWRKQPKHFRIEYSLLEERPTIS